MSNDGSRKLLTIDELVQLINIKKSAVYDLVFRKKIPYIKIGNRLRFREDMIQNWLDSHTHIPFEMRICYNDHDKAEGEEIK